MPRGVYSNARRKAWTEADRMVVEEMIAAGRSIREIARKMKRSENSVKVYTARNLKLRVIRPMTAHKVAVTLGLGCGKTVTRWIAQGYLRGYRTNLGAAQNKQWLVTEDALLDFMRAPEHWHRWEPERIADWTLREWAQETRTETYYTQAEVAKRYSVVIATVAQWMDRGFLRYADTGSHRMVPASALVGFVVPSDRPKAGYSARRFTPDEDARLLALRDGGASWAECEYQLRRSLGSCAGRYARLVARRDVLAVAA